MPSASTDVTIFCDTVDDDLVTVHIVVLEKKCITTHNETHLVQNSPCHPNKQSMMDCAVEKMQFSFVNFYEFLCVKLCDCQIKCLFFFFIIIKTAKLNNMTSCNCKPITVTQQ